jgi:hypothetical protein
LQPLLLYAGVLTHKGFQQIIYREEKEEAVTEAADIPIRGYWSLLRKKKYLPGC